MANNGQNVIKESFYLFTFSPLFLIIFIMALKKKLVTNEIIMLLSSILLYSAGYLSLFLEERFLIFPQILLVIITILLLNNIIERNLKLGKYKWLLYFIIFTSITVKPLYSLLNNINSDKEYFILSEKLKKLHINGNFAGISRVPLSKDWGATLFLAYELNSKYYGEIDSKLNTDSIYYNLKRNSINYLFVWDHNKLITHPAMHEILETDLKNINIDQSEAFTMVVRKFYSIFNLEVTPKEKTCLKLYKLD
jgi:hypothetical protein